MNLHLGDWSEYALRWIHLITGISWIGSSFYFMWLDAALEKPKDDRRPELEGSLWMVHSGGFYEVERKKIGPGRMPAVLHWFKYEALFTWISGLALLAVAYYRHASAFMIDPAVAQVSPGVAVVGSALALFLSWGVYDGLWESPIGKKSPNIATALSLLLAGGFAYGFCKYLSGRAAFIHVGAMFGTWMVANVWQRILPAQQRMIDATQEGRAPDFAHSAHAKRRSVHNTYMTFPVLFMMLSNHYSHAYGTLHNWGVLMLLIVFGASIRHVMVGKNGSGRWAIAPAAISLIALIWLSADRSRLNATVDITGERVSFAQAQAVITSRCVVCHAANPSIKTFGPTPGGVSFETVERIKSLAERIKFRAVETKTMPLANMTQITDEERALLGRWVDQGAKIED